MTRFEKLKDKAIVLGFNSYTTFQLTLEEAIAELERYFGPEGRYGTGHEPKEDIDGIIFVIQDREEDAE